MERYEMLEACALSGQMSDAQLYDLMLDDPEFAEWVRRRAEERQS